MEIYDDNDNRYDAPLLTFNAVKDRVEAFIENNDEVLEYIEDLIEGLAEESRVERLLSNKYKSHIGYQLQPQPVKESNQNQKLKLMDLLLYLNMECVGKLHMYHNLWLIVSKQSLL